MRAVRTLRDIKYKKGTLVKGSIELVTQENRIVQGIFMNEIIQGFECEYVDVAIILQENESLKNPEKQIHVRMVEDVYQGNGGSIKAGSELFGRIMQVDPLCQMFQCTIGEHSGKKAPYKSYVEISDGKTYAEQRVIELEQENLQRLEEVKGLQAELDKAKRYGQDANALGLRARNELIVSESNVKRLREDLSSINEGARNKHESLIKANNELSRFVGMYKAEREARIYLEATLERAMLDHQPVVLPKEVAQEIQGYFNKGYTKLDIVSSVKCSFVNVHPSRYSPLEKYAEQYQNNFLRALADGYTVEQTAEEANEEAFRAGMEAIYKEMDKEPFNSTAEKWAELAGRLIPLIKEIYKH